MKDWQPLPGWIQVVPLDSEDWSKPWGVAKVGEAVKGMSFVEGGDWVLLRDHKHVRLIGDLLFVDSGEIVAKLVGE